MLKILNNNYQCVGILNFQGNLEKITPYFDDKYYQNLETGAETFEFSTIGNSKQAQHLTVGNHIVFKDNDGVTRLFTIINVEDIHEENFIKNVYCEICGLELINNIVRPLTVNGKNCYLFLQSILQDTEWKVGYVDSKLSQPKDFEITDYKTVYEVLQEYVIGTYEGEISFRAEFSNNRLVGKYIDVYSERNAKFEHLFSYKKNMSNVTRTIDSSNLVTALIGVGNNNVTFKNIQADDKPLDQDFVENKTALQKWGKNGQHLMGVFKADTDDSATLLDLTRQELEKNIEPHITYEVKGELLDKIPHIGATVGITDHDLDLYLTARISELTTSKTDSTTNDCVFSNFKEVKSKIKDISTAGILAELKTYLESLETGILTETALENIERYLNELNLTKEEIDIMFDALKITKVPVEEETEEESYDASDDELVTLQGKKQEFTIKDNTTYNCNTLTSLFFKLPSKAVETFSAKLVFTTPKNTSPMYFRQSSLVWLSGDDCIRGALLPTADTKYEIIIKYNANETIPRKYRGSVKKTSYGGSYKEHQGFCGAEKVIELAQQFYDNRGLFTYNTTTPLSNFASGTPASNVTKWKTGDLFHIDCSTFINFLFKGRGYKNSIYANLSYGIGKSTKYSFGLDLGRFASAQAETCVRNGWHLSDVKTKEDWSKLKKGDLIFWSSRSTEGSRNEIVASRFMQVGHVGVVAEVITDETNGNDVLLYDVSNLDGTVLYRKLSKNHPDKILFFARIRK